MRSFVLLFAAALLACAGCVAREPLTIAPSTMTASVSPANRTEGETVVMVENATLLARVRFRSVDRWGLVVDAEGRKGANGRWPQVRVTAGGISYGAITIDRESRSRYWLGFRTEPGLSDIRLTFLNGNGKASGPAVTIARLELVPL